MFEVLSMVSETLTSRGRDHVHGRLVAVEDFEDAVQEAVRHQHARGVNVDERDLALAGDRLHHVVAVDALRR